MVNLFRLVNTAATIIVAVDLREQLIHILAQETITTYHNTYLDSKGCDILWSPLYHILPQGWNFVSILELTWCVPCTENSEDEASFYCIFLHLTKAGRLTVKSSDFWFVSWAGGQNIPLSLSLSRDFCKRFWWYLVIGLESLGNSSSRVAMLVVSRIQKTCLCYWFLINALMSADNNRNTHWRGCDRCHRTAHASVLSFRKYCQPHEQNRNHGRKRKDKRVWIYIQVREHVLLIFTLL